MDFHSKVSSQIVPLKHTIELRYIDLGIDMPLGKMSFSKAKAIDLAWNTIVGRLLHTFLSLMAYRTFTNALMLVCERHHIDYSLFAALALATTRPESLKPLSRSLFVWKGFKVQFILLWLIISVIYLAAFPTTIDAVSGYQGLQTTEVSILCIHF